MTIWLYGTVWLRIFWTRHYDCKSEASVAVLVISLGSQRGGRGRGKEQEEERKESQAGKEEANDICVGVLRGKEKRRKREERTGRRKRMRKKVM